MKVFLRNFGFGLLLILFCAGSVFASGIARPNDSINRAEMAKLLVLSQTNQEFVTKNFQKFIQNKWQIVYFDDVKSDQWYAPYVALAKEKNMVGGYANKTFRPAEQVNFAEGLKMILGAYGVDVSRTRFKGTDLILMSQSDWFAPYFSYALSKNLINPEKFYHPAQLMTRGEMADILDRLRWAKETGASEYDGHEPLTSEYRITIPSLGLINQDVGFADPYDGKKSLDLLRHVPFGHYLAEPGSGKKFVLFGHSSGYAWDKSPYKVVLRQINKLKEGDKIYINYHGKGHAYKISQQEIIPAETAVRLLNNQQEDKMIVYTCWPPDSIKQRYVIYAEPVPNKNTQLSTNTQVAQGN